MAVTTPWGYDVTATATGTELDALPPILDESDFRTLVPDLSSTSEQVCAVLDAASAAVRDWCGWHVGPALACEWTGDGEGTMALLPLMAVRAVESVEVSGEELDADAYEWRHTGLIRRVDGAAFPDSWRSVVVQCVAGAESASMQQVVAQVAANALTAAPGVAEEHAGSVGITYNRTADGVTGGVRLLQSDRDALAPYRLSRAW